MMGEGMREEGRGCGVRLHAGEGDGELREIDLDRMRVVGGKGFGAKFEALKDEEIGWRDDVREEGKDIIARGECPGGIR